MTVGPSLKHRHVKTNQPTTTPDNLRPKPELFTHWTTKSDPFAPNNNFSKYSIFNPNSNEIPGVDIKSKAKTGYPTPKTNYQNEHQQQQLNFNCKSQSIAMSQPQQPPGRTGMVGFEVVALDNPRPEVLRSRNEYVQLPSSPVSPFCGTPGFQEHMEIIHLQPLTPSRPTIPTHSQRPPARPYQDSLLRGCSHSPSGSGTGSLVQSRHHRAVPTLPRGELIPPRVSSRRSSADARAAPNTAVRLPAAPVGPRRGQTFSSRHNSSISPLGGAPSTSSAGICNCCDRRTVEKRKSRYGSDNGTANNNNGNCENNVPTSCGNTSNNDVATPNRHHQRRHHQEHCRKRSLQGSGTSRERSGSSSSRCQHAVWQHRKHHRHHNVSSCSRSSSSNTRHQLCDPMPMVSIGDNSCSQQQQQQQRPQNNRQQQQRTITSQASSRSTTPKSSGIRDKGPVAILKETSLEATIVNNQLQQATSSTASASENQFPFSTTYNSPQLRTLVQQTVLSPSTSTSTSPASQPPLDRPLLPVSSAVTTKHRRYKSLSSLMPPAWLAILNRGQTQTSSPSLPSHKASVVSKMSNEPKIGSFERRRNSQPASIDHRILQQSPSRTTAGERPRPPLTLEEQRELLRSLEQSVVVPQSKLAYPIVSGDNHEDSYYHLTNGLMGSDGTDVTDSGTNMPSTSIGSGAYAAARAGTSMAPPVIPPRRILDSVMTTPPVPLKRHPMRGNPSASMSDAADDNKVNAVIETSSRCPGDRRHYHQRLQPSVSDVNRSGQLNQQVCDTMSSSSITLASSIHQQPIPQTSISSSDPSRRSRWFRSAFGSQRQQISRTQPRKMPLHCAFSSRNNNHMTTTLDNNNSSTTSSSIICRDCGRCRCVACRTPRRLPSCWFSDGNCLCSTSTVIDAATCMLAVNTCLRVTTGRHSVNSSTLSVDGNKREKHGCRLPPCPKCCQSLASSHTDLPQQQQQHYYHHGLKTSRRSHTSLLTLCGLRRATAPPEPSQPARSASVPGIRAHRTDSDVYLPASGFNDIRTDERTPVKWWSPASWFRSSSRGASLRTNRKPLHDTRVGKYKTGATVALPQCSPSLNDTQLTSLSSTPSPANSPVTERNWNSKPRVNNELISSTNESQREQLEHQQQHHSQQSTPDLCKICYGLGCCKCVDSAASEHYSENQHSPTCCLPHHNARGESTCLRLTAYGLACALFPCFWFYLPCKAVEACVEHSYAGYHDNGCKCDIDD